MNHSQYAGVAIVAALVKSTEVARRLRLVFLIIWCMPYGANANLVFNNDFKLGNLGFSTDFRFSPGNILDAQTFDIVSNPRSVHRSAESYFDHSTGDPSGLMMAVNGSRRPDDIVWSQSIDVSHDTTYEFGIWSSTWFSPADLSVRINGVAIAPDFSTPKSNGVWQQFTAPWNSGESSLADIEIVNVATATSGNDFALDDISFAVPEPTPPQRFQNGSFELPTVIGSNQEIRAPSNAVDGWLVTEGSIDLVRTGSTVLGSAHSGNQMIDINGSRAGAIEQDFPTAVGFPYRVSLFYSNNPNPSMSEPSYSAAVDILSGSESLLSETIIHSGATATQMNWQPFTGAFIADSEASVLRLRSLQPGFNGVYFDTASVSLIPDDVGDFDKDGVLDAFDIDLLMLAIRRGSTGDAFDLTGDGAVLDDDARLWVAGLKRTFFGDANLDGEFTSGDLIQIFKAGEYEDALPQNSGWANGDWNADGEFNTSDLVVAFRDGGYEQGPRAAVSVVPEPRSLGMLIVSLLGVAARRQRGLHNHSSDESA